MLIDRFCQPFVPLVPLSFLACLATHAGSVAAYRNTIIGMGIKWLCSYAADGSLCMAPKMFPSVSFAYTSHPTCGTAILGTTIDPP